MEDQRNWSDASYKTYVRPLAPPWPYTLPKGEKVAAGGPARRLRQAAGRLGRRGEPADPRHARRAKAAALPAIGIGVPAEEAAPALAGIALVESARPRDGSSARSTSAAAMAGRSSSATAALGEATGADIVLEIVTTGGIDPVAELMPLADAVAARPASTLRRSRSSRPRT